MLFSLCFSCADSRFFLFLFSFFFSFPDSQLPSRLATTAVKLCHCNQSSQTNILLHLLEFSISNIPPAISIPPSFTKSPICTQVRPLRNSCCGIITTSFFIFLFLFLLFLVIQFSFFYRISVASLHFYSSINQHIHSSYKPLCAPVASHHTGK